MKLINLTKSEIPESTFFTAVNLSQNDWETVKKLLTFDDYPIPLVDSELFRRAKEIVGIAINYHARDKDVWGVLIEPEAFFASLLEREFYNNGIKTAHLFVSSGIISLIDSSDNFICYRCD